jgi:hypothetical protein
MEQTKSQASNIILGDNIRDYKKFLEIEKMSANSNNPLNISNGNNSNNNFNNTNNTNLSSFSSTNSSRVPFTYTPIRKADTSNNLPITQNTINVNRPLSNNTMSYYPINNNNNFQTNFGSDVYKEIQNMKNLISKSFQNQSEMQEKIIEYNKIISEQEKIIRINNIKLNEHDSKLTEILLSFNNYLQLNEKSTTIINEVQKKLDDCVKNLDFNELKGTVYQFNKNNENKINEIIHTLGDMNLNLSEMKKENEQYQKFTLEKIKTVQTEAVESRLQQQNELIKMDESKENRINAQFAQVKNMVDITNKNLIEETDFRKKMINDVRNEFMQIFTKNDEKISGLEKSQLETEKNLISLNKDYMKTFNDLISKHNEKYTLEFKSIRSLLEAGLSKVETKMSDNNKIYDEAITALKENIQEQKIHLSDFENFVKESINGIEKKYEEIQELNKQYFNKLDLLSSTLDNYMKENNELIATKEKEIKESLTKIFKEETDTIKNEIRNNDDNTTKKISDLNERVNDISGNIAQGALNNLKGDVNIQGSSDPNAVLVREYVERLCAENLQPMKEIMKNYELMLTNTMNMKFEESRQKYSLEQKENMGKIVEMMEKKMAYLDSQLDIKIKEQNTIIDGRVQQYIVESEKRMDENIKKIKNEIIKN